MMTERILLDVPYEAAGLAAKERNACLETYILKPRVYQDGYEEKGRPAVIICPGGGYEMVSPREGEPIALKMTGQGYHAFVLTYSVDKDVFPTQLLELATAVALVRSCSRKWHIDPDKIIVMGFSAGGHLALSLGTFWNRDFLKEALSLTGGEMRPNGLILSYPVVTSGAFAHQGSFKNLLGEKAGDEMARQFVSLETQVTKDVPKTFLWHTYTDLTVPVENSLLLASALRKNGTSLELHIYPEGPHGLSLANEETAKDEGGIVPACQSWMDLAKDWIRYHIS